MTKRESRVAEILATEVMEWHLDGIDEGWWVSPLGDVMASQEEWNPMKSAEQCFGPGGVQETWSKQDGSFIAYDYEGTKVYCDAFAPEELGSSGGSDGETISEALCLALVRALGHDIPGEEE